MRYPGYLRFLDAFGLFAFLMACWHVFRAPTEPDSRLDGILGNLSTELIGIYISVRLIDFVVRSYQNYRDARIDTVKNMRVLEGYLHRIEDFKAMRDLRVFKKEFDWFQEQFLKRKKHLKADEITDVQNYVSKLNEVWEILPDVKLEEIGRQINIPKSMLGPHFDEIERLRERAERNILKETAE